MLAKAMWPNQPPPSLRRRASPFGESASIGAIRPALACNRCGHVIAVEYRQVPARPQHPPSLGHERLRLHLDHVRQALLHLGRGRGDAGVDIGHGYLPRGSGLIPGTIVARCAAGS
jgi:hypothetical protein